MYISLTTIFWTCLIVGYIIYKVIDNQNAIRRQDKKDSEEIELKWKRQSKEIEERVRKHRRPSYWIEEMFDGVEPKRKKR